MPTHLDNWRFDCLLGKPVCWVMSAKRLARVMSLLGVPRLQQVIVKLIVWRGGCSYYTLWMLQNEVQHSCPFLPKHRHACTLSVHPYPKLLVESLLMPGNQDSVSLRPIYTALGAFKAAALPGFHAFSGCDSTDSLFKTENLLIGKCLTFLTTELNVRSPH